MADYRIPGFVLLATCAKRQTAVAERNSRLAEHTAKLIAEMQLSAARRGFHVTTETGGAIVFERPGHLSRQACRARLSADPTLDHTLAVLAIITKG
jgi:hypothetical protein